jgi:hypothetical protein
MCHLVTLLGAVLRHPRTHSGRRAGRRDADVFDDTLVMFLHYAGNGIGLSDFADPVPITGAPRREQAGVRGGTTVRSG